MNTEQEDTLVKQYRPLANAAGFGSMLGSGIIIGLSTTLAVWQDGLHLTDSQTGLLSGLLTLMVGFGSLFGGRIAESIGLVKTFNWTNLFLPNWCIILHFLDRSCFLVNRFSNRWFDFWDGPASFIGGHFTRCTRQDG